MKNTVDFASQPGRVAPKSDTGNTKKSPLSRTHGD